MRGFIITSIFSGFILFVAGQQILVKQWDKRFGGTNADETAFFQQTSDGGYIIAGSSFSPISGDKTQDNWDTSNMTADYWIVKIDGNGNKEWDKRFGTTSADWLGQVAQTEDGGYILGGASGGPASDDKTEAGRGGADYWIVKIDSLGNKQWDKTFGGSDDDNFGSIQQTTDKGYIIGGYSISPVSGDKTQACFGDYDYWIVKTDSLGNKQWDKDFGGTNREIMGSGSLTQSCDGGYLIGGFSLSDSSGDKTQNNWTNNYNYWVVKTDSVGNKIWDRRFGGLSEDDLEAVLSTTDGGFIIGGYSFSGIGGDKTQDNWGLTDYWIIKIDSLGNKEWDKDYGGTGAEELWSLALTTDGGYLLGGYSNSDSSGDKTEGRLGIGQTWAVKIDSVGNKLWDKTAFTTGNDQYSGWAIETKDGCYVMANFTNAGIGGDKTQPSWGIDGDSTDDYWMVKFCFGPAAINEITDTINMNVYPNPFSSELDISLAQQGLKTATFTITDMLGQIVYSQQENNLSDNYTKMLDLSYLANGVYLVTVTVNGERITKQVVKQGP